MMDQRDAGEQAAAFRIRALRLEQDGAGSSWLSHAYGNRRAKHSETFRNLHKHAAFVDRGIRETAETCLGRRGVTSGNVGGDRIGPVIANLTFTTSAQISGRDRARIWQQMALGFTECFAQKLP